MHALDGLMKSVGFVTILVLEVQLFMGSGEAVPCSQSSVQEVLRLGFINMNLITHVLIMWSQSTWINA